MPRVNELGQVLTGVGGPVAVDGRVIAERGTVAQWWNRYFAVYQRRVSTNPERWIVEVQDARDGSTTTLSSIGCDFLAARKGAWAAWNGVVGLFGSVESSFRAGLSPTDTDNRGAIAEDGTVGLKADYQGLGPIELVPPWRRLGDPANASIYPSPYGLCVLDERRAVWNGGGSVGFAEPLEFLPGAVAITHARALDANWWTYWVEGVGLVSHRTGGLKAGRLLSTRAAFFPHSILSDAGRLLACWSRDVGESPDGYELRDVWLEPPVDLTALVVEPITPQNRPMWLGPYTGRPGAAGGWDTNDDPQLQSMPGNGYLDVPSFTLYDARARPVASYCPGSTVEEVEARARAAPHTPIAYWDARLWPRWPVLPKNSWLCLQGYCRADERPAHMESVLDALLTDLQQRLPDQLVALVAQAYTQRDDLTNDIKALVSVFSRLGARHRNVVAFLPFNGNGRKGGLQDNPAARARWAELAATIPGAPAIVPVEADVKAPKVSIKDPIGPFSKDGFTLSVHDPNNDQDFIVTTKDGSWYVEIRNQVDSDKSVRPRPVIIKE